MNSLLYTQSISLIRSAQHWTKYSLWCMAGATLLLSACSSVPTPLVQHQTLQKGITPDVYVVKEGDSLTRIAQNYGLDYVSIAQLNNLNPPYNIIYVGQTLRLKGAKRIDASQTPKQVNQGSATYLQNYSQQGVKNPISPQYVAQSWHSPVKSFTQKSYNFQTHTLYYHSPVRTPVYAVAEGMVVYAQNAPVSPAYKFLSLAGNVVIIQHPNQHYSIYSHNHQVLVNAGQQVKAGQQIAEVGNSGQTSQTGLGLQIRSANTVIDPRAFF